MLQITFRAMNCQMIATVDGESPRIANRLEQVPDWFESWEQRLSRFRPDSELNQINQRVGEDMQVSSLMQEVLHAAIRADRLSQGLVTPTILDALERAGYDRSFDQLLADQLLAGAERKPDASRTPNPEAGEWNSAFFAPVEKTPPAIQLKRRTRTVHLAPGARLDLGGIAKGWSADRAADRLRPLGPVMVEAGGDVAISGPMADGEPWVIGVENPFYPEKEIDRLLVERGGVATSGRDYRRWMKKALWQHHIIDPRSGRPAQTDVLTATVIGPSAQAAEVAAKVVLISGSAQGLAWLDQRPELAGMVVLEDGQLAHSRRWMNYVWR